MRHPVSEFFSRLPHFSELIERENRAEPCSDPRRERAAGRLAPMSRSLSSHRWVSWGIWPHIYDRLGFNRLLGTRPVASSRVLRDMVLARLAQPASKLASAALLRRNFGIEINVDQVYRMMDHFDPTLQAKMQQLAKTAAFDLLGQKVDVMFFNCTTLYFESVEADSLRQKGFSKDHKSAETQVVLALLVTREGLPVAYRLSPGNQCEGYPVLHALDE